MQNSKGGLNGFKWLDLIKEHSKLIYKTQNSVIGEKAKDQNNSPAFPHDGRFSVRMIRLI